MGLFDSLFSKASSVMGGNIKETDSSYKSYTEDDLIKYNEQAARIWKSLIDGGAMVISLDTNNTSFHNAEMIMLNNLRFPEPWSDFDYNNIFKGENAVFVKTWYGNGEGVTAKYTRIIPAANVMSYMPMDNGDAHSIGDMIKADLMYIIESWDNGISDFYEILKLVAKDHFKEMPVKLIGLHKGGVHQSNYEYVLDLSDAHFIVDSYRRLFEMCSFESLILPKDIHISTKGLYNVFSYCNIGSVYIKKITFHSNVTITSLTDDTKIKYMLIDELVSDNVVKPEGFFGVGHISHLVVMLNVNKLDISGMFKSKYMKQLCIKGNAKSIKYTDAFADTRISRCNLSVFRDKQIDKSEFNTLVTDTLILN